LKELQKIVSYLKEQNWITGSPTIINSGKEATVYLCQATSGADVENYALKLYHSVNQRNFANTAIYREGWDIPDSRARRAMKRNNRIGKAMVAGLWISSEYDALSSLYQVGASVPKPYTRVGKCIVMDFVGRDSIPAIPLYQCQFTPSIAKQCYQMILENIEIFLAMDRVHSDLSPYNILHDGEKITIIDFPQVVDARSNRNAERLLLRDVQNVTNWATKFGIADHAQTIAMDLWNRYQRMEL
jgi:RIO kinase 1